MNLVMFVRILPGGLVTDTTDYESCLVRLELCDVRLASRLVREASSLRDGQSRENVGGSALANRTWSRSCKMRLNRLCSFIVAWLGDRKNEGATSPIFSCCAFICCMSLFAYI